MVVSIFFYFRKKAQQSIEFDVHYGVDDFAEGISASFCINAESG